ncbi:hypothetical protein ACNSOS_08255 [Aliarcobacter vitoriensis]|uniref:hypothetical protein n=1 Tax=Aliarcobacter vitoriensis TaxID=2011099 RepID=UPI003AB01C87
MEIFVLFIALCIFIVIIFYLLSLDKLAKLIRDENNSITIIHRAWVWTQLIPIWSVVAIIVYHIKILEATKVLELNLSLPKNTIKYPEIIGWVFALAFLYSWIPVIGAIVGCSVWIIYWIRIILTSKQIYNLKN